MLRSDATRLWIPTAIAMTLLLACPLVGQGQTYRRATGRLLPGSPSAEFPRLTARDAERSDFFGWTVAISGDLLAVCAINADDPVDGDPTNVGAVVVFVRDEGVWRERQTVHNPDPGLNESFGSTLALSDDHLFVGIPYETVGDVIQAGSVYAYTRVDNEIVGLPVHIKSDEPRDYASFGSSLTIDGDNLLVGSTRAGEDDEGKVFVFSQNGDSWETTETLIPDDGIEDNYFGAATAVSGDWLVVGAPGDKQGVVWAAGAAYVYRRIADKWVQQQKLVASDADWWDSFGGPVAISGGTIMISAGGKDHPTHDDAGAVYVFTETSGHWAHGVQLFAPDPSFGTGWGRSLALTGDTAIIGFPLTQQSPLPNDGAVDILTRSNHVWSYAERLVSPQPESSGEFGQSLALSGSDLLIGAPLEDAPGPVWDAGAAYVISVPDLVKANKQTQNEWEDLQANEEN